MAEKFILDSDTTVLADLPETASLNAIQELKTHANVTPMFSYATKEWLDYFTELQELTQSIANKTVDKELRELTIAVLYGKRSVVLESCAGRGDVRTFAFKVVSSSLKRHQTVKKIFTDVTREIYKQNTDVKFSVIETLSVVNPEGVRVLTVCLSGTLNEELRQGAIIKLTNLVKKGLLVLQ